MIDYKRILGITAIILSAMFSPSTSTAGRFGVDGGKFMLDGEPYIIKAAELHYPRIPEPYWEHRIQMCKALGMNTICLYVFWNVHEPEPDKFDFSGDKNLRKFVELCRDNGMNVILRPGPYVCAEWEMGGLPWWLLQKKDIELRRNDPYFLERVEKFEEQVAREVGDLTADKGGPILMIQVENEYGSYGTDKEYMANIRDIVRKNFGEDATLFQCDWSSNFLNNGLDDLLWTLNFGTWANIEEEFSPLKGTRPGGPLMCSEYWSGWFDKWGAAHETRPGEDMANGIEEMLSKDISFSLYMTHGGTNPGHWGGANSPGYAPNVTSYDYDAPINEAGQPTAKYYLLRDVLAKYYDGELPSIPAAKDTMSIPRFTLTEFSSMPDILREPKTDSVAQSMEQYGQGYGSILYQTRLSEIAAGDTLRFEGIHDYAQIFADGRHIATLDRREGEKETVMPKLAAGTVLDILVEGMGRINFGPDIKDFKGIVGKVEIIKEGEKTGKELRDWRIYNIEDDYEYYNGVKFKPAEEALRHDSGRLPRGVYRGKFNLEKAADTFLDFEKWGKGMVYVNGHPLGRIWSIGPQQTLYTPGCYLKEGENEILIFDIVGPEALTVEGKSDPVLDKLKVSDAN